MFNRRFIREKAVQAYYAYSQGGAESALACSENFLTGLRQTSELYFWQLSFVVALSDYAAVQYKEAADRARRSEEDLEGMRMMAQNRVVERLRTDSGLGLESAQYGVRDREAQTDLVRSVYESLFLNKGQGSAAGRAQARLEGGRTPEETFNVHKEFLKKLYKKKIAGHSALHSFCEERSIYWETDYESACFWAYSTISKMEYEGTNPVEPAWSKDDEDVLFGKNLLDKTLLNREEYNGYITANSENWAQDRIGSTEMAVLGMAVSEFINCPSIPVKVTMNEYLEVAKRLCAKESVPFVNGVLNKVAEDLTARKIIRKSGRGLIDKK